MYIDPVEEYRDLLYWIQSHVNKSVTSRKLINSLKSWLSRSHPVRVRLSEGKNSGLNHGDFAIGAEYDPELDQANKKQLVLDVIIKRSKTETFILDQKFSDEFVMELVEVFVHEYQHQHQYRSRRYRSNKVRYISKNKNNDIKAEEEYLGDRDEIEAYGANIAARIFLKESFIKDRDINIKTCISRCDSLDLKTYYKTFGKEHRVVRELINEIRKNLIYLEGVKHGKIRKRKGYGKPILRRREFERGWFRGR